MDKSLLILAVIIGAFIGGFLEDVLCAGAMSRCAFKDISVKNCMFLNGWEQKQ